MVPLRGSIPGVTAQECSAEIGRLQNHQKVRGKCNLQINGSSNGGGLNGRASAHYCRSEYKCGQSEKKGETDAESGREKSTENPDLDVHRSCLPEASWKRAVASPCHKCDPPVYGKVSAHRYVRSDRTAGAP